jgi:hypothetical protein
VSIEVLLIPVGIALFAAWRESRSTDLCEKCKSTRIVSQELLVEALGEMEATNISQAEGRVTATTSFGSVTFQLVGETFLGRVDKATEPATLTMLSEMERTVGRLTQARSAERIQQRASELGLRLITHTDDNGVVQLVFEQN